MTETLRVGYIPLVDAAALIVAVDGGLTAAEGLNVELVRDVSWSNVRDKLNIGLLDAAHLLSPVAIASSLGIGHVRVPIVVPFNLGLNGNAITVSPWLYEDLAATGDLSDPAASARALARVIAERKARNADLLTFGMTFPFSHHNYQLRFWMASADIDPDEDVRLVVLPPPYMVDSLASGHVDGFCVGAPWNSVAVGDGIGHILHFGCEIQARVAEKVFAVRESWAKAQPELLSSLLRALAAAVRFLEQPENQQPVAAMVARRVGVESDLIARALTGHLKVASDGPVRSDPRYLLIGRDGAARPDPVQAAWIYAQMVRWGQAPMSDKLLEIAQSVFRPDLYDAAVGAQLAGVHDSGDGVGAFTGPSFDPTDVGAHLAAWRVRNPSRPRLSLVR